MSVSRAAARAVWGGHPWVWREGFHHPAGTPLALRDGDRTVGWGLADSGPIAVRVLGRGDPPDRLYPEIADRVRRADALRYRLVGSDTDCWRVIAGAGDGLEGLVVDRYAGLAVIRVYSAAWEPHLAEVVAALAGLPWVETVFRRFGVANVDDREGGETLHGRAPPDALVVTEHGMKLLVRPWVGQKTGLFLDQREHRLLVRQLAAGRRVANLFAYNGGFSVAAALGGAAQVTTVDLAPEAVSDARENFALNGLDPDAHAFEVADAFAWSPRGSVDLLIVDPPSLSRGKATEAAAGAAYRKLHQRLGPFVSRDGLLVTSSCTARLPLEAWRKAVSDGLAGDWSWHWTSQAPLDHPVALSHHEGHYLKLAVLRRR